MRIHTDACQDLDRALSLEWLETNGRGGFASGTVAGANTRRYHAILLVARTPPVERHVLVNHLDEWIDHETGRVYLSTNLYNGQVHPDGYRRCQSFTTEPWPTWRYAHGAIALQKEIFCSWGRDVVVVRWRLTESPTERVTLRVRPMLSGRDYHATHHENAALSTQASTGDRAVSWQPYADLPSVRVLHNGQYAHAPDWYRRLHLMREQERGLDDQEDWWSPGELSFALEPGWSAELVFTTEALEDARVSDLEKEELARRRQLVNAAPPRNSLAKALWSAAPNYFSIRGDRHTILAGFPWFTDWGRDTFISLPGLCLVTGWHELAWQIIDGFAGHVSEGMVPNRFPDRDGQPEYNTIDASLWFIHAVDRYLTYSEDELHVRHQTWPAIKQILDGYRRGVRLGIRQDTDGLIMGGTSGAPLTWMDVKIGDQPLTPRHGKPVEVQALWVRALAIGEDLASRFGEPDYAAQCRRDREQAVRAFRDRFWCEASGHLYDVIDGPDGDDATLRPNQLYAIMFGDGLVTKEQANRILDVIRERLVTPVGLRTLPPRDARYRPRFAGGVVERDSAYHQGTVWPFLLGPFVTAWMRTKGASPQVKKQARGFLQGLEAHLGEAGLGHISEVFDAEPPHEPRGCPAQAWSVAEPLRVLIEDLGVTASTGTKRTKTARPPKGAPRQATARRTKTRKR